MRYSAENEFLRWHLSGDNVGFRLRAVGTLVASDSWGGGFDKIALACCKKLIQRYSTVMKALNIKKETSSFSAPGDGEDYDAEKFYEMIPKHVDETRLFSLLAKSLHFDKYIFLAQHKWSNIITCDLILLQLCSIQMWQVS